MGKNAYVSAMSTNKQHLFVLFKTVLTFTQRLRTGHCFGKRDIIYSGLFGMRGGRIASEDTGISGLSEDALLKQLEALDCISCISLKYGQTHTESGPFYNFRFSE